MDCVCKYATIALLVVCWEEKGLGTIHGCDFESLFTAQVRDRTIEALNFLTGEPIVLLPQLIAQRHAHKHAHKHAEYNINDNLMNKAHYLSILFAFSSSDTHIGASLDEGVNGTRYYYTKVSL